VVKAKAKAAGLIKVETVVEALVLFAVPAEVLVDPLLALGQQLLDFLMPVPVGGPPSRHSAGAALQQARDPVGELITVGVSGHVLGCTGPLVPGADDPADQGVRGMPLLTGNLRNRRLPYCRLGAREASLMTLCQHAGTRLGGDRFT
jgi:hypothetical protein